MQLWILYTLDKIKQQSQDVNDINLQAAKSVFKLAPSMLKFSKVAPTSKRDKRKLWLFFPSKQTKVHLCGCNHLFVVRKAFEKTRRLRALHSHYRLYEKCASYEA